MWIKMDMPPTVPGFYWLIDTHRTRILGHRGIDGVFRGMNAGGEPFALQDNYTHWAAVMEPTGASLK
jgi:hypothetical protein